VPLLYIFAGAALLWLYEHSSGNKGLPRPRGAALLRAEVQHLHDVSVAWYVGHLMAVAQAAATLDRIRPLIETGNAGNIEGLMASDEAGKALSALAAPLDALTLQRDLNMLGAKPALAENGKMDSATQEAVLSIQKRFGQVPTGNVDSDARIAITYGVGKVYARDASALCGIRMGW
jgi:hypothetical protein